MIRMMAVAALALTLSGCATLTIATVGGLVAAGALGGAGKFAGYKISERAYARHVARRCSPYYGRAYRRCVRSY